MRVFRQQAQGEKREKEGQLKKRNGVSRDQRSTEFQNTTHGVFCCQGNEHVKTWDTEICLGHIQHKQTPAIQPSVHLLH